MATNNATEEQLLYLDQLRESGETNMFGARPYLQQQFGLEKDTASRVLSEWMRTYSERHPEAGA